VNNGQYGITLSANDYADTAPTLSQTAETIVCYARNSDAYDGAFRIVAGDDLALQECAVCDHNGTLSWTYTPTTPGDWLVAPTCVGEALDYLEGRGVGLAASLFQGTADKTIASTASETTLVPASGEGSVTLPANLLTVGKAILILIKGHISDTGNPTLTLKVTLGGTTLATSAAITLGNVSSDYWEIEHEIVCRTTGATGSVVSSGEFSYENANDMNGVGLVNTSAVTIDTTGTLALDVTAQWGTSSASNTITAQIFTVEELD
jgi:hypothetical protein